MKVITYFSHKNNLICNILKIIKFNLDKKKKALSLTSLFLNVILKMLIFLLWDKAERSFMPESRSKTRKAVIQGVSLTLFFCLYAGLLPLGRMAGLAFAAAPTIRTISPSSGSTAPDVAKTFTTTYSDTDGWANLKEAYLLISTGTTALANSVYLYYDQNTNLLYLRDDANTAWLGGFAPASANVIENSYVKLNCASTTASGATNTLTIAWNLTFKPAYSGKAYNTYLYITDDTGGKAGWTKKGTYTVNYTPAVGTITPASGTGAVETPQTFTATYSDADGWQNIQYVYFLLSTSTSATTNTLYAYYNQNTNLLYLRDDANTSWLGGFAPGSGNVIENSYAKLNCQTTSVSGSGVTMTVNWSVVIKAPLTGTKNTYLYVRDDLNTYVNLTQKGTWTIPNNTPATGTITPASGSSSPDQPVSFTATYSDADTWLNIQYVYFLVNTSTFGTNCLYAYYNQNTNKLYLRNDANFSWLGGFAPASANIIENTYAKLDCAATTISGSGNTLTVNWRVTFKSGFLGAKNMYLYVRDDVNAYKNWTQAGSWSIQQGDTTPPTGTIKINNDSQYTKSTTVTLTLSAEDNPGGSGLSQMQFSNDGVTWSTLETYSTTKTWTLDSTEGTKTVYVKYKDVAGNWSAGFSDTITLDATPPLISINPVLSPTNQNVVLSYIVTDNFTPQDEIVITGDNSPYTTEGDYNVTLTCQDKAGNSSSQSISFTIDKTGPVVVITSPVDGAVVEDSPIELQGTIDGVAFSEMRTLTEGANTLTRTATDSAGNTASASVTVYLYLGELIGPEGGEVLSLDGKVKVIIPEGALSEQQQIKILTLNKEALESAAPGGTSLLSVVECRPYGLVFNKPVSIIYTLYQAEIPGTPVELGFYDSVQKKIISTGQTSTVPADGYTLTFSIMHFSTYAALKNLTPQSTPIGSGVKIPLPDMLTGSFSHAIPITIPPGRKGMQPALALSYRSSNPNSWVGLGFSLNPAYIVRSTRLGPPTYNDTQDTFYFITDAGTTELVWLIDNLYQAKVESSFTKFLKESDDSWKVMGKDGSILRFGQVLDSRETSTSGIFAWYLTKVIDTNGNYIEYHYLKDQGKTYLSRIDYTGNEMGVSPANSVEFTLETRDDITSSYISTSKIATSRRLKEIQVKQNSDLVWRYVLEYNYSPDTNRSLLKSITQYGSDNKNLPTQRFVYQGAK